MHPILGWWSIWRAQRGRSMTEARALWWPGFAMSAGDVVTARVTASPVLMARIDGAMSAAIACWPAFNAGISELAVAVGAQLLPCQHEAEILAWCDAARLDDFYLALCCGRGETIAIEAFEKHFASDFGRATRRFHGQRFHADDLHQILLEKLFVGPGAKILEYAGRGHLQNWLRVTATHTFIDVIRGGAQRKREELVAHDTLESALLDDALLHDAELQFLKTEYRAAFKQAFAQALQELDASHRTILRQHLVERMSIDELSAVYGSHRSSAARWLAAARDALMHDTRAVLKTQLEVSVNELDSILALIRSRFDVSMTRLLKEG